MGLFDKVFGGGTNLELKLDAAQIPEGGMLSGSIALTGGKKPLKLTSLKVRLVYVKVTSVPDQPLPKVEMQILIDNAVASNVDLAPASLHKFSFTLNVPKGTDPKGAYQVITVADIPGVKDPSASADLKVVAAQARGFFGQAKGAEAVDAEEIFRRFPGLRAEGEDSISSALYELSMASYEPDANLLAAEPLLARLMREGSDRVREAALSAWGTILNNRARPEHIQTLTAMARDPQTPRRLLREVVSVAAKFAEEGALPLISELAVHPDPEIREEVATRLYIDADPKLADRKPLLVALANDEMAGVRAAAFRAFASFAEDQKIVNLCVRALGQDPSPDVQQACVRAIAPAHWHGMRELVFSTLLAATRNRFPAVREAVAESVSWLPKDPRLAEITGALLADESVEVRRRMAWQGVNMAEHPELASMFVRAAREDSAQEVRADALQGLSRLMPLADAIALYRERLTSDMSEATGYAVVNGLRDVAKEPLAEAVLIELTKCPYARVADHARSALQDR
ncbi:MAG: HEAT repeat domain-containing protein [Deltaproteobacteria bacterium]|nr:HEAT repeat domain-containing protein [Deltaproteobacteria bacterium]